MFEESELVNLFSGIIGLIILMTFGNRTKMPHIRFFYVAFALMLCAYIATVAESVLWNTFFNDVEHAMIALASLSTAVACWRLHKASHSGQEFGDGQ